LSALAALIVFTAPIRAAEYRMLTSWDRSNPAVPLLAHGFADNVKQASNGRITFILNGPETVPGFEQLQPVAAGAFHALFTHGVYHYGATGISVALDAIGGTLQQRRESGLSDLLDKFYQKMGLKVLAMAITEKDGYTFQLKAPVSAEGDFKGRKIRGTPSYHAVIRLLGGAPVVLPIPEVYSAMEKGVIDGAASPVVSLLGYKWYEVAKYVTQPSFGYTHQLMLMNLNTWKGLPAADQKVLLDAGRKLEEVWHQQYTPMAEQEIKELQAKGVTLSKLGPSREKLNQVWAEGLWALAEKKSPTEAKELRALAKSKGLTN
jgi:TRAP-type mannitol/chloroaromatic compound transport system substrate-binding protein